MQNLFEPLTDYFRKNQGLLTRDDLLQFIEKRATLDESADTIAILLQANGYPIEELEDSYIFKPMHTNYKDQEYVVVDIETNGSKPGYSQVIEIGAIKIKNMKIVDRLETFVQCAYIPQNISELTGIVLKDLDGAPSRKEALSTFKEFLSDSIFVAHNVLFDYTFLSASFKRFGLGCIGNMRLCTIDLARRTIESEKYGLLGLSETLNIDMKNHHRAYSDALCSWEIMQHSLKNLPSHIDSSDELIKFSLSSKKERKSKS